MEARRFHPGFCLIFPVAVLIFAFLVSSAVYAQFDKEQLIHFYLQRVRELIKFNYYRHVTDKAMIKGAIEKMSRVDSSMKAPSKYDWRTFQLYYLGLSRGKPELAGKLGEAALEGMVDALGDPYSVLLTPQKQENMESDDGSAIGVELGARDGKVVIIAPLVGSPAEKAGLIAGDRLEAVKGKPVKGLTYYGASMLIKGREGESIDITVMRNGKKVTCRPVFAQLQIKPIEYMLLSNNIGYIRIRTFTGKIFQEFQYALDVMKKKKVRGLILDLRNNPGGDFNEALRVAARFVPDGTLVWVEKERKAAVPQRSGSGETFPAPVVVLVNEGSASASEVLSAALGENKKATLMGRKTFGKGVVQTDFKLTGNAILRLTTEKYLTPDKHDINGRGIHPQITLPNATQNPVPTKDRFVISAWKYLNGKVR